MVYLLAAGASAMPEGAARTAAVAAWMALWWVLEAIPIPATALLPIVLLPALGILSAQNTSSQYGHHFVFLLFGGFLIARAIQAAGLHRRIALRTLITVGTSPPGLLLGFMLAAAALSMWISNTATSVMLLPIAVAVADRVGDRRFGRSLMLAVAYACSIGGIGTLVGTAPNAVFAGLMAEIFPGAPEIGFTEWLLVGLPVVVVLLPATWAYLVIAGGWGRRVDRARAAGVGADLHQELERLGPLSTQERRAALVFAGTALLWITRRPVAVAGVVMPGWSQLFPDPSMITDAVVAVFGALVLFIVPAGTSAAARRALLTWDEAVTIPWGVLLLFGGGFALASAFAASGLAAWIGGQLGAFAGLPPFGLMLAVALTMTFLTELTSNTAATTTILPILAAAAPALGVHPTVLMLPATVAASCAFMLPTATPPNAVVFGSKLLRIGEMARAGLALNLLLSVLLCLVLYAVGLGALGVEQPGVLPAWARN